MRTRALLGTAMLALVAVGLVAALTGGGSNKASAAVKRVHVRFLFSQDAASGSLKGPDDQHLTLTLRGVRDWLTRFDDRPFRAGQTVDVLDFLDRWHKRFAASPPNAVLSYRVSSDDRPRDMVLELRNPRYDAAAHTITYAARRELRTTDRLPGTKHPLKAVRYPIPADFGAASLFIDDAGEDICVDDNGDEVACWAPDPGGGDGSGDGGGGGGGSSGPVMM